MKLYFEIYIVRHHKFKNHDKYGLQYGLWYKVDNQGRKTDKIAHTSLFRKSQLSDLYLSLLYFLTKRHTILYKDRHILIYI